MGAFRVVGCKYRAFRISIVEVIYKGVMEMKWEWPWKKSPPEQAEPKTVRYSKPPIVLNILEKDKVFDDTPTQFMGYGWYWGNMTPAVKMIDEMIRTAWGAFGNKGTVIQMTADLTFKLSLKAAQLIPPEHVKRSDSFTSILLYIPAGITFEDFDIIDGITGLPSQGMLDHLRYIAIRLESRITSVTMIHETGEFMVAFQSWQKNYTLEDNDVRWGMKHSDDGTIKFKE